MYMKKRTVVSIIMAALMLTSCGKTQVVSNDDTSTDATTVEATTKAPENEVTDKEDITDISESSQEYSETPGLDGDMVVPGDSQYKLLMEKIDELEEELPGRTYSFAAGYGDTSVYWCLNASRSDKNEVYYIRDGEVVKAAEWTINPDYYSGFYYKTIKSFPLLVDSVLGYYAYIGADHLNFESKLPDGIYSGNILGFSDDYKYVFIEYGDHVRVDSQIAGTLEPGNSFDVIGLGTLTVTGYNEETETYTLDNGMSLCKGGLMNVYDDEWYINDNGMAYSFLDGMVVLEIDSGCPVIEGSNSQDENTLSVLSDYSGQGFENTYYANYFKDFNGTSLDNNNWHETSCYPGYLTEFKVSGNIIREMKIEYYYGIQ